MLLQIMLAQLVLIILVFTLSIEFNIIMITELLILEISQMINGESKIED